MKIKVKFFLILFVIDFFYQHTNATHRVDDNNRKETLSPQDTMNGGSKIRVATYNLRYNASADKQSCNGWRIRKYPMARLIKNNDIDIVGTQEANFHQMNDLMKLLSGYAYIGNPYGGSNGHLHTASIIYKKSMFKVLDQGEFWYSPTPNMESIGWDATDLRICTWAKMRYKPGNQEFYFFTSHFYWRYHTAKKHSGKVMVKMIKEIITNNNLPVISTGDLNSISSSSQVRDISNFLQDAYNIVSVPRLGPDNTNLGGGNFIGPLIDRIDYVFVNNKVRVLSYITLDTTYNNGRHPSDHLPVVCDLSLER